MIGENFTLSARHGRAASITPQQFQHLPVELPPAKLFVLHVGAAAVERTEGAAEIPHRPAPAGFLPEFELVAHPGQHDRVRRPVECAALADVHPYAFGFELLPRLDALAAQALLVPRALFIFLERPGRLGPLVGAFYPIRLVMAEA